jgi:hypothetical protein
LAGDHVRVSANEPRRRPAWAVLPRRVLARWIIPVYALLAVALVPWVVWLAWTLPERSVSAHYRLGWVGFDVLLCGALARTAWLAWRRSPFVVNVASATAALLVVDAWFDVTTSPGGQDLLVSAVAALAVELPLAVFSLVIAARAQIQIARNGVEARSLLLRLLGNGNVFGVADPALAEKPGANPPPDPANATPPLATPLVAGTPLTAPKATGEALPQAVNPPPAAALDRLVPPAAP